MAAVVYLVDSRTAMRHLILLIFMIWSRFQKYLRWISTALAEIYYHPEITCPLHIADFMELSHSVVDCGIIRQQFYFYFGCILLASSY